MSVTRLGSAFKTFTGKGRVMRPFLRVSSRLSYGAAHAPVSAMDSMAERMRKENPNANRVYQETD